jgi:predicted secreted protein
MYFLVPFSLLVIFNVLIILKATRFARTQQNEASATTSAVAKNGRKTQMTRVVLATTFLLLIISLPGAIMEGYFFLNIFVMDVGPLIINLLDDLTFTFPAFNFFILFYSNKLFAAELKSILFGLTQSSLGSNSMSTKHSVIIVNNINKRNSNVK